MVQDIASIEVVLVNNESESLLLENNLIKIHKPPYNRALKRDNSGYAYLQMTDERFPRLTEYYRDRRLRTVRGSGGADKAAASGKEHRFGPYRSARFRDAVLDFVTEHYKLRTCDKMPKRVCLLYHLGKCSGVCEGKITEEAYRETARQAADLLLNRGENLIPAMRAKMSEYAERLEFEKAGSMLRHLRILEEMPEKQIVDREGSTHQDVLYFGEERVLIAKVQEGMLRDFQMHELERAYGEVACDRFLVSRYGETEGPDELIVNKVSDPGSLRALLRRTGGRAIKITTPKRGLKYDLLQLCKDNYEYRVGRDGKKP
ncbi:nucleotide excision repair endonuclease [Paenibacillus tyrfis]|uniref:nucleotide excision repair endonuclease n=1 Tax=Paenibacillus tyrfis TaxID=1501230 RepID=UPI00209F7BE3|nr:nucleotide excision repair endonuclease [Paenibacillus tyrfis]MCP1309925.1 nucleotide excision repair endonuclease [Paenibacillus tyrfis]